MISIESPVVRSGHALEEPVSSSRLNCFHSCRLKFFFRYVEGLRKPASVALHVGSCVHRALQEWSRRRWLGRPCASEDLREDFEEAWMSEQLNNPVSFESEDEPTQRDKAWGLVEMYLAQTPIPVNEKPEAVEVSVEVDLTQHGLTTLRGFIDIIRPEGRIVDFKTTASSPDPQQAYHRNLLQLTIYGVLYEEATGVKARGFELHHLVKTKVPKLVVTEHPATGEPEKTRLFRSIESYLAGVEREDWVASPGLQCASCEYFQLCPGGLP